MPKDCVLYDRKCIDCGECLVCDLDNSKICDNCGRCIDEIEEYRTLNIEEFTDERKDMEKFQKQHSKKNKKVFKEKE